MCICVYALVIRPNYRETNQKARAIPHECITASAQAHYIIVCVSVVISTICNGIGAYVELFIIRSIYFRCVFQNGKRPAIFTNRWPAMFAPSAIAFFPTLIFYLIYLDIAIQKFGRTGISSRLSLSNPRETKNGFRYE